MSEGFLNKVYSARDAAGTRRLYDEWSASYEAEVGENGYATPGRCAAALRAHIRDPEQAVLDFGCGTGLSGLAFKIAGFSTIDGVDLSGDMLAKARAKGIYRHLTRIEADTPLAVRPGDYAAVAAIGVIGAGAAPVGVIDMLMDSLAPKGQFVFSFNDHTLEDPAYSDRIASYIDTGRARLRFREHGDHLPGIGVKSTVYIIEKT